YLDLDRFSEVNDQFGRATGDEVLVEVARRLSAGVRQSDLPARPGGDEFAVLLPSVSSTGEAEAVAARVIDCFAEPVLVGTTELAMTASVGIALSEPSDDFDAFLVRADRAMYVAKAAGPGQVRLVA
ncbi:MAG: GGDEF domain-containing protein, partial [Actinomycetota bacterium]|nr:GGDEF domain-containing protein [Actinomycetota bacterium]